MRASYFEADVTAAMLVERNKAYSSMGTRIILFEWKCCGKYMHCFAYQLGRLVTWLESKDSGNPPVFYINCQ